jgi:hypothetical protein
MTNAMTKTITKSGVTMTKAGAMAMAEAKTCAEAITKAKT